MTAGFAGTESVAAPRFHALLASSFAALAVLLAAAGIYGLLHGLRAAPRDCRADAPGARRGDVVVA